MTSITVGAEVIERLKNAILGAQIHDADGNMLGYFCPDIPPEELQNYECPLSAEELDQRAQEPGGRSLEEILADLRKLP